MGIRKLRIRWRRRWWLSKRLWDGVHEYAMRVRRRAAVDESLNLRLPSPDHTRLSAMRSPEVAGRLAAAQATTSLFTSSSPRGLVYGTNVRISIASKRYRESDSNCAEIFVFDYWSNDRNRPAISLTSRTGHANPRPGGPERIYLLRLQRNPSVILQYDKSTFLVQLL